MWVTVLRILSTFEFVYQQLVGSKFLHPHDRINLTVDMPQPIPWHLPDSAKCRIKHGGGGRFWNTSSQIPSYRANITYPSRNSKTRKSSQRPSYNPHTVQASPDRPNTDCTITTHGWLSRNHELYSTN